MNGDLRIYPELGYVVVSLSNIDPPAASSIVEFFTLRMPDHSDRRSKTARVCSRADEGNRTPVFSLGS